MFCGNKLLLSADADLYACAVENPEIPGFFVSKSIGLLTDHKQVKKIET